MGKERIDVDDAAEQIIQLVEEAEVGDLLDMYKLLCNPTARLVKLSNGEFNFEFTNEDY